MRYVEGEPVTCIDCCIERPGDKVKHYFALKNQPKAHGGYIVHVTQPCRQCRSRRYHKKKQAAKMMITTCAMRRKESASNRVSQSN